MLHDNLFSIVIIVLSSGVYDRWLKNVAGVFKLIL
jgi:hypothetical protein